MKKQVIFDMDGVIFDSEALVLSCWKIVAEKYGLEGICLLYTSDAADER